jgi:hypothetical protein
MHHQVNDPHLAEAGDRLCHASEKCGDVVLTRPRGISLREVVSDLGSRIVIVRDVRDSGTGSSTGDDPGSGEYS